MSNNYQRLFYILKNMDNDLGYPVGYLKLEINSDIAKLQISANNLLERSELEYRLIGVKKTDSSISYTVICDIPLVNGRADLKVNVDTNKVGTPLLKLEEINVFAIITSLPDKKTSIKCAMVAYTKEELPWRKELEEYLVSEEMNNYSNNEVRKEEAETTKQIDSYEEEKETINIHIEEIVEAKKQDEFNIEPKVRTEKSSYNAEVSSNNIVEEKRENEIYEGTPNFEEYIKRLPTEIPPEALNDVAEESISADAVVYSNRIESIGENPKEITINITENAGNTITDENDDILSYTERNFKEISAINIDRDKVPRGISIQSLREELDKSFEICNPFKISSKNIRWWKINSPGYLNNILFRNNIKTYLIFNPKVMLAHYKYRYIIFGIRNGKHLGKEHLLCGVPGVYNIDENPFGEMGSWAQLEGYKPKYGAFGYWIILVEPKTGKLLKAK